MRKTAGSERERSRTRRQKREDHRRISLSLSFPVFSRSLWRRSILCFDFGRDSPRRTVAFSEEMDRWSAGCPIPPRAKSGYSRRFAPRTLERKASRLCPSSPFAGKCTEGKLADHAAVHSPTAHEVCSKESEREKEIVPKIKSVRCVKL